MSAYQEQLNRVERWMARLRDRCRDQTEYLDFLWSFFQNCWHVKDWIKNDAELPQSVRDSVEKDLNEFRALLACADLANRSKHLELKKIRKDARLRREIELQVWENVATGETFSAASFEYFVVLEDGSSRPAIDVGNEAVSDWKTLLSKYGLSVA